MQITSRLKAAKAAYVANCSALNELSQQMQQIDAAAQPAAMAASSAESLKQQRRSIFSRMLKLGSVNTNDSEARALGKQIANAEQDAEQAQAVLEAKNEALAELQAKAYELHQYNADIQRELLEAQLDAAGIEINGQLIPKLRAAAESFQQALGELVGAGAAHCQFAQKVRNQFGTSVSSLGVEHPARFVDIVVIGFGIADNGCFNTLRLDLMQTTEQAKADTLARWQAV